MFPEDYSKVIYDETDNRFITSDIRLSSIPNCYALETQMDIHSILLQLLYEEASKKSSKVLMLLQPDHDFLFHALSGLAPVNTLSIEHILCLNNTEELTSDNQLMHIKYLRTIFPLFVSANLSYEPYYYHDDIEAKFTVFNLLPYFVLTSAHLLLCTPDYQQGIVFTDPAIISLYKKRFEDAKKKCNPLFQVSIVDLSQSDQFLPIKNLIEPNNSTYIIQEEGCLLPLLQEEMIHEIISSSLPQKDELVRMYSAWCQNTRDTQLAADASWMHQFFTRNGFLYFVRTGYFRELPSVLCSPLSTNSKIMHIAVSNGRVCEANRPRCEANRSRCVVETAT